MSGGAECQVQGRLRTPSRALCWGPQAPGRLARRARRAATVHLPCGGADSCPSPRCPWMGARGSACHPTPREGSNQGSWLQTDPFPSPSRAPAVERKKHVKYHICDPVRPSMGWCELFEKCPLPRPEYVFPKGSGDGRTWGQRSAQTCRLLLRAHLCRRMTPGPSDCRLEAVVSPPPASAPCSGPHWGRWPGNRPPDPVSMLDPTKQHGIYSSDMESGMGAAACLPEGRPSRTTLPVLQPGQVSCNRYQKPCTFSAAPTSRRASRQGEGEPNRCRWCLKNILFGG